MEDKIQPKRKKVAKKVEVEIIPPMVPVARKMGRPTSYTPEAKNFICEAIAEGKTLTELCSGKSLRRIYCISRC